MPTAQRHARRTRKPRGRAAGAVLSGLAGAGLALWSMACTRAAPTTAAVCERVARVPAGPGAVKRLRLPDGDAEEVSIACKSASCLRQLGDIVVVDDEGPELWVATAAHPDGRAVPRLAPPDGAAQQPPADDVAVSPDEQRARVIAAASARDDRRRQGDGRQPAPLPPELPPTLRTCGATHAGGGLGFHIIQNDGDVWQRIHWAVPPTDAAVAALPADAYPIVDASGALCAYGRQIKPRTWVIHHVASGRVVPTVDDEEHAQARCSRDGGVIVRQEGQALHVAPDGGEVVVPVVEQGARSSMLEQSSGPLSVEGRVLWEPPPAALPVVRKDGSRAELALPADRDLTGAPLPAGAVRRRLVAEGDGQRFMLVIERFALRHCGVEERVALLDTATLQARPISRGEVVVLRPRAVHGRFWWLEAELVDVDLGG